MWQNTRSPAMVFERYFAQVLSSRNHKRSITMVQMPVVVPLNS
jgi:hypothetical protein